MQAKLYFLVIIIASLTFCNTAFAQDKNYYIRVVNLVVDAAQMESYKATLKEDIEEAVHTEPACNIRVSELTG